MIYEAVAVENPTDSEREDGKLEKIIFTVPAFVAANEKSAAMSIMMNEEYKKKLKSIDPARLELLVRPF